MIQFGAALLGPVGLAYLLVSGSSEEENPCKKALEIAGRGATDTPPQAGKTSGTEGKKQGLGDRILNLFK